MTARKPLARLATVSAVALLTLAAVPAAHAAPSGPAAGADAYGLLVDVGLLPSHTPVRHGPVSRASQDSPPGAAAPAEAHVQSAGPVPSDGSLVNHVGVLTSIAGADDTPQGVASAEVVDVSLLKQGSTPAVSADLVRAQANSNCTDSPNSTGTTFVNLKINGTPVDNTPAPNTTYDLTYAKVILNEQHPAYDGRGIVVNAIHVISTTTSDALWRGDIIVSHAMSTVVCPGGPGSTGDSNPVKIVKTVSPSTAIAGDELTYDITVNNTSGQACLVTAIIDHLPMGFEFVSTSGDLGTALDRTPPPNRPGGGQELYVGNGKSIASGATAKQQFVVKVGENVAPGVYYNNVEVFCANLGNFIKGLDAPVEVTEERDEPAEPSPGPTEQPSAPANPAPVPPSDSAPLPHTGTSPLWAIAGATLVGLAVTVRRLRAQA